MYYEEEDIFYYITLMNENYVMPILPMGSTEGICRGMYRLSVHDLGKDRPSVDLMASGAILREALRAQEILNHKFAISSRVFSVTSWKRLLEDAREADRHNRLHPEEPARVPYVQEVLAGTDGSIVAASDYVSAVPLSLAKWIPGDYTVLGTDGFGRSEARPELRRFFEVDAEHIVLAALSSLANRGKYPKDRLPSVIAELGIDPNKPVPWKV